VIARKLILFVAFAITGYAQNILLPDFSGAYSGFSLIIKDSIRNQYMLDEVLLG
jgi:hypothetical protein